MNTAMILLGATIILAVYGATNIYIGTRLFQWLKWPGRIRFAAGSAALLLTACVVGYGIFNAHQVRHVSYTVQTGEAKAPAGLHIVLISDLHLGAVHSEKHLERIIDEINRLEPDLVCMAGDIFNDDFNAIRDPDKASALLRSLKTRYGVYASLGNHDSGKTFGLMTAFLERSNVNLLTDEYVIVDGRLALFGRVDPSPIAGLAAWSERRLRTSWRPSTRLCPWWSWTIRRTISTSMTAGWIWCSPGTPTRGKSSPPI